MFDQNNPQTQALSLSTAGADTTGIDRPRVSHGSFLALNEGKGFPLPCVCPMRLSPLNGARAPHHLPPCVFYEGAQGRSVKLTKTRDKWLNWSLQVSSSPLAGVYSHTVRLKRLVPNGSGAFGIIERMPPWGATDAEVASFSFKMISELRQGFGRSLSRPSDEQYDGRSLLGAACSLTPLTAAESLHQFELFKFLIGIGCATDDPSTDSKNHPLAVLLAHGRGERMGDIASLLCMDHVSCDTVAEKLSIPASLKLLSFHHRLGCPIHTVMMSAIDSPPPSNEAEDLGSTRPSYPTSNEHNAHQEDVGSQPQTDSHARIEEFDAIIQRDLKGSEIHSNSLPQSSYNRKRNHQLNLPDNLRVALLYDAAVSPVRLAHILEDWPDLTREPAVMLLVMAQAARLESLESVESLLNAGSPITSSSISVSGGSSVSTLLIENLAMRRQHLRHLAFEVLPPEAVKKLELSPWSLPDINLRPLCSVFRQHGFGIGSYLEGITHVQSVFHAPGLNPHHMEALWRAGFRDIDVPDAFGHTPLVAWNVECPLQVSLSRAEWLIDHGADVHRVTSSNSTSVCHHVCLNLMHQFTAMCYEQRRVSKTLEDALGPVYDAISGVRDSSRALVGNAFRSPVTDRCICRCSIDGCTPLTVALRHVIGTIELLSASEDIRDACYKHDLVRGVYEILLMNAIHLGGSAAKVVPSVLRLLTFDALGLTHTCCRENETLDLQPFSQLDAEEIHDEERLLLLDLEFLINRFQKEYETLGIPLWDFVETHWSVEMTENLQSKGESIDPSSLCVILALRLCNEGIRLPHANPTALRRAQDHTHTPVAMVGAALIARSSMELLDLLANLASTKEFQLVTELLIYLAASLTEELGTSSIHPSIIRDVNAIIISSPYVAMEHSSLDLEWPSIARTSATIGIVLIRIFLETVLERLSRPQVPSGYERLTWTCQHCRHTFTETVREMFPGAATDWIRQLNQAQIRDSRSTSGVTPLPPAFPRQPRPSKALVSHPIQQSAKGNNAGANVVMNKIIHPISQAAARLFRSVYKTGGNPSNTRPPQTFPQSGRTGQPGAADAKYLLLAIPSYRGKDRLIHLDIQHATTDEELYRNIGQIYNTARRRWKWIRLRSLSHIEWKQFYIYHSDKIALNRKADEDWPQCGRISCETGCKLAVDYEYSPRPAPVDPPIPRQALMHFLENPDHAGSKIFHRDTVPKRDDFLSLGPNDHLREGWCLAFIEALSWAKIAAIEGIIGIGSLLITVAWIETHGSGSISDAFAPSCWMLALGAIMLTLVYHHEQ